MMPWISLKKSLSMLESIDPDASINTAMSIISSLRMPGMIASMCHPRRLAFIQLKSLLTVLSIFRRSSSRQFSTGSVRSLISLRTPNGMLPASEVCAADSIASLISSRILARSSSLSLGRPLPSVSWSLLPSPSM